MSRKYSNSPSAIRKRKWREEKPELYLKNNREANWRTWGIDINKANELRTTITCCQICGSDVPLHVDHCHTSKLIRGMLCRRCNHVIDLMEDKSSLLRLAVDYLDKHGKVVYN